MRSITMRRKSVKLTPARSLASSRAVKNAGFGRLSATTEMLSSPGSGLTGFFGRSRVSLSGRASAAAAGLFTTTGVFISIGVGLIDVTTVAVGEAACDRVALSFVALTVEALTVGVVAVGTETDGAGATEDGTVGEGAE